MNKCKEFVGIDISKATFDVCYSDSKHQQFSNDESGIKEFIKTLSYENHCVMEQTGNYHKPLATSLQEHGFTVSVENPLVIKRFIQMNLRSTKTDKADAQMIMEYGKQFQPKEWKRSKQYITVCKQLRSVVVLYQKQSIALKSQKHSFISSGDDTKELINLIDQEISQLKKKIKDLENRMEELVKANEQTMLSNLSSIKGIAKRTAILLIIHTNGFSDFRTSKQLSAYFGLSPQVRQSGTSLKGRGNISKSGNKDLRKMMFMCALSASVYNKGCRDQFQRLVGKGKCRKVALIAVSNKLLKQALAVAKSGVPYDPEFVSKKS